MKTWIKIFEDTPNRLRYLFIEKINNNNAEIISIGYNQYGYIVTIVYRCENEIL